MTRLPLDAHLGRASRRSVLRGGLGAALATGVGGLGLGLTGCSYSDGPDDEADQQPEASVTPDVRVATEALVAIRATHQAVRATSKRFPAVTTTLTRLDALHAAHERSLVQAVPDRARSAAPSPPYAVPRRRDPALRRLQVSEGQLHDTLQALSVKAQSGDFALLLASMAAGITVHRNVLATDPG